MILLRLVFGVLLLVWSASTYPHRLDQYLQATSVTVGRDRLTFDLRLTPGVAVAPLVLSRMGAANDAVITSAIQARYADSLERDLAVTVDGTPLALRLISVSFPTVAAMRNGLGDISISFDARLPAGNATRTLTFENSHQQPIAVYLVNCLVPDDPGIRILGQKRNVDQSRFELRFSIAGAAAGQASATVGQTPQADGSYVLRTFLYHGIGHILTGYDHLLFACALVLAVTTLWDLLTVVTAFTIAHSLTLALAALDLIHVSSRLVEPVIAASIVLVAVQNIFWPASAGKGSRVGVAFVFGLFHGLGFAGGLLDLMHHLPRATALLAILGFSVGIEVGHQLVLLPLFGMLEALRNAQRRGALRAGAVLTLQRAGSAVIAAAGLYYFAIAAAAAR